MKVIELILGFCFVKPIYSTVTYTVVEFTKAMALISFLLCLLYTLILVDG